jgi:hypothetical protein
MLRSTFVLTLSLCTTSLGCLGTEAEKKAQGERLEECWDGASEQEVQDNILITQEYAGSLATSLQLSWLPTLFAIDFLLLCGETLAGGVSGSPPDWSFDAGVYRYGGQAAAVELQVLLGEDSPVGPPGTPVAENIFLLDSYLEGATVVPNQDGSVTIDFMQPGPLVELLGLGVDPPNPLTLTTAEREIIVENLSTLAIEPDYVSYGVTPLLAWDLHWVSPPETIASIAAGNFPIDIQLVEVSATRDDLGQTLTTNVWNVDQRFGDVGGYTTFTVSGGHFPYRGRIDFSSTPFILVLAERTLDCL